MIKIFLDKLLYSPFEFKHYIKQFKLKNIVIVKKAIDANIIASSYLTILKKWSQKYKKNKNYLLWTHEPYHDFTLKPLVSLKNGAHIHIMNVYTGDVFTHNFRYFYFKTQINWNGVLTKFRQIINDPDKNKIIALSTFYDEKYYKNNPYTILPTRYKVIEKGYKENLVDVIGKNWNNHPFIKAVKNSRNDPDRRKSKLELLDNYCFNICLENTDFKYYVTEKIWEPIKAGCLPIYWGNSTIYQIFERDSFIDVKQWIKEHDVEEGISKMYNFINNISESEFMDRYRKCVQAFNKVIDKGHNNTQILKSHNLNINYLEYETCYNKMLKKIEQISGQTRKKLDLKMRKKIV
tara:strand:- start:1309 stop:2355 length:1047 start_codon:yes stop_codon:yes gene_type:complete